MQFDAFVIDMPLRHPYTASGHAVSTRRGIIVRLTDGEFAGWGEFVELPGYTHETVDTALAVLSDEPVTHSNPAAVASLRTAQLDLEAKRTGVPLATLLGGKPGPVSAGAAVAHLGDEEATVRAVAERVAEGYEKIKVKVGPGFDVAPLQAVREEHPSLPLAADANGAYQPGQVPVELDGIGLLYLEQPYPPTTPWSEFAALRTRLTTPIGLDESITGPPTLRSAIAAAACDVVVLKAARVAGLRTAAAMHDLAMSAGLDLVAGGMLETGIGRGAAAALACLPGFTITADLSASDRYWEHDLTEPWELVDGALIVGDQPGIGVEVDQARLRSVTVAHHQLSGGLASE